MKILKFTEFLNESHSSEETVPEIQGFLQDGYMIRTRKKGEDVKNNVILLSDNNPHSYCLSYHDKNGQERDKIWIPKEFLKMTEEGDEIVVTLHPDNKWISKKANRVALEDFVEDYLNHKLEITNSEDQLLKEISADISTILEILELPLTIEKIQKNSDHEYEVYFENGGYLDFSRADSSNLFKSLKFFKDAEDNQPSLIVNRNQSSADFDFSNPELGKRKFSCFLDEAPANPYFNFLVKKSMDKETHGDEESLLQFFLQELAQNANEINPELPRNIENKNFVRDLKSAVSSFVPEEKLRMMLPSKF
jgi:hypothetical protein